MNKRERYNEIRLTLIVSGKMTSVGGRVSLRYVEV